MKNSHELLKDFKRRYLDLLNKGEKITFEDILRETLYYFSGDRPKKNDVEEMANWFQNIHLMKFLSPFLKTSFQEIILHGPKLLWLISNKKESFELELSPEEYQLSLEVLSHQYKQNWNHHKPFASFKITLNSIELRATLLHHSITPERTSKLFLRYQSPVTFKLENFQIKEKEESFIQSLILNKANILVAGSTGSGKTSFLRSLLSYVSKEEHVIILEDTHEIIPQSDSQTHLLAGENKENSLTTFCSYALRLRPDRMILGEIRGNEVIPYLLAMNTGHKGLLSSIHANSAQDALSRMALLFSIYGEGKDLNYNMVLDLICKNIEYIIYMENKKILHLAKVIGSENGIPFTESL